MIRKFLSLYFFFFQGYVGVGGLVGISLVGFCKCMCFPEQGERLNCVVSYQGRIHR